MIKTYLVPTTEEMVDAMKEGEAPSFLSVATCLDDLTKGEVLMMVLKAKITRLDSEHNLVFAELDKFRKAFDLDWWNRKWGE